MSANPFTSPDEDFDESKAIGPEQKSNANKTILRYCLEDLLNFKFFNHNQVLAYYIIDFLRLASSQILRIPIGRLENTQQKRSIGISKQVEVVPFCGIAILGSFAVFFS